MAFFSGPGQGRCSEKYTKLARDVHWRFETEKLICPIVVKWESRIEPCPLNIQKGMQRVGTINEWL